MDGTTTASSSPAQQLAKDTVDLRRNLQAGSEALIDEKWQLALSRYEECFKLLLKHDAKVLAVNLNILSG